MSAFLNILRIIVQIFPAVIELIRAIESAVPVSGVGTAKLELLNGIVAEAYNAAGDAAQGVSLESLTKAVSSIASKVVSLFKKVGIFS